MPHMTAAPMTRDVDNAAHRQDLQCCQCTRLRRSHTLIYAAASVNAISQPTYHNHAAASVNAIAPFAAALLSLLIFRELPPATYFAALALMAAGAWLSASDKPLVRKKAA